MDIGTDLQDGTGIGEPMHLIEDDRSGPDRRVERFGILSQALHAREVAVEDGGVGHLLG